MNKLVLWVILSLLCGFVSGFGIGLAVSELSAATPAETLLDTARSVNVPAPPTDPASIAEVEVFLNQYTGWIELAMRQTYLNEDIDCDDYARQLRDSAWSRGLAIETEAFNRGEWNGREYQKKAHLACKAFVDVENRVYIIDPLTREYWQYWRID